MKDLNISWNEGKGFYCEEFASEYFYLVLENLISKYGLKFERDKKLLIGEIEMLEEVKLQNPDYNIELLEEDGSEWVYG